jgi:hypothetical protein
MTESPSPFTMLFSRHTRRREFIAGLAGAVAGPLAASGQPPPEAGAVGHLYRACHPAILGHRDRGPTTTTLLFRQLCGFTPPVTSALLAY